MRSIVLGIGSYLPERMITNDDLAKTVDTSDEWIRERTGITRRHFVAQGEQTSDLGVAAALRAIEDAGIEPASIDLVIVATSTPDNTFPATATAVQRKLGLPIGIAFDVQAVCAGFVYALSVADAMLVTGRARRALVVGAESFSKILDFNDRSTCVLFGDGAGAVVLAATEQPGHVTDRGILATALAADGRQYDHLFVDGGASSTGTIGVLRMNGREVFRHAVQRLAETAIEVVAKAGLRMADIDYLIPHQANRRIIEAVGKRLDIPADQVVVTVDRHANTSAASIPLALDVAVKDGRIKEGDLLVLNAMGGGFTWGAALLRW
ncbi:MAG TPA: beta-ketoacyl-ACP synthase III [Geminicoccus sp.]|uniref:beta-ketoacyl-ACP synthase III n=1 Tax=Geminicoccus sp. TaxID=2024832 RepID=UPI002E372DAF|nr:beta-ketoacyl-ACP synthase III [Geminicoccus sp.]HEX2525540.1 beta-ketoacyl-ACP synthase III [Geminicoccus sp.]